MKRFNVCKKIGKNIDSVSLIAFIKECVNESNGTNCNVFLDDILNLFEFHRNDRDVYIKIMNPSNDEECYSMEEIIFYIKNDKNRTHDFDEYFYYMFGGNPIKKIIDDDEYEDSIIVKFDNDWVVWDLVRNVVDCEAFDDEERTLRVVNGHTEWVTDDEYEDYVFEKRHEY